MTRFGLPESIESHILNCGEVGFLLWRKGWCEGAAGNLSIRLETKLNSYAPSHLHKPLGQAVPDLAGEQFLVSASGARFRDIAKAPEQCLGILEIAEDGASYAVLWGFEGGRRPSSEIPAHMAVHQQRQRIQQPINAVLHAHATNLIALSFVPMFQRDPDILMGILYRMHTEAYMGLHKGIALVGFRVPGGQELADDAATALSRSDLALWSHHGSIAVGQSLDTAMDLLEYGDKAAQLFLMASQRNDAAAYLSSYDLKQLKAAFHGNQ